VRIVPKIKLSRNLRFCESKKFTNENCCGFI
jgi:hypothetical protein